MGLGDPSRPSRLARGRRACCRAGVVGCRRVRVLRGVPVAGRRIRVGRPAATAVQPIGFARGVVEEGWRDGFGERSAGRRGLRTPGLRPAGRAGGRRIQDDAAHRLSGHAGRTPREPRRPGHKTGRGGCHGRSLLMGNVGGWDRRGRKGTGPRRGAEQEPCQLRDGVVGGATEAGGWASDESRGCGQDRGLSPDGHRVGGGHPRAPVPRDRSRGVIVAEPLNAEPRRTRPGRP